VKPEKEEGGEPSDHELDAYSVEEKQQEKPKDPLDLMREQLNKTKEQYL
jgi:hypothetical protein